MVTQMSHTFKACQGKADCQSTMASICKVTLNQNKTEQSVSLFLPPSVVWWAPPCHWRFTEHYISWLSQPIPCQPALSLGAGCGGGMADSGGNTSGLGSVRWHYVCVWLLGTEGLSTGEFVHEVDQSGTEWGRSFWTFSASCISG